MLSLPMVCCDCAPWFRYELYAILRSEDIYNVLDKPIVEPHNKIRVAGEYFMHILKRNGREGVAQGTVEQRRGHFLVLGV